MNPDPTNANDDFRSRVAVAIKDYSCSKLTIKTPLVHSRGPRAGRGVERLDPVRADHATDPDVPVQERRAAVWLSGFVGTISLTVFPAVFI